MPLFTSSFFPFQIRTIFPLHSIRINRNWNTYVTEKLLKTLHVSTANENTENRLLLLDLLIKASEDRKVLLNQDIRQEIDTFMFEVLNIIL